MRVYKHHISSHFEEDPTLLHNNGAGRGGTVFLNFQKMLERLSKSQQDWHYCELDVEEYEIQRNNQDPDLATILVNKKADGSFKSLPMKGD